MSRNIGIVLGKVSGKRKIIENIKIINHRLSNILGFCESSINRLKNADLKTVRKRWDTLKDVIIATGRGRINKEIKFYRKDGRIIEKASEKWYSDISKQLYQVDRYYKDMFDLLGNSKRYSEKHENAVLASGEEMVRYLKDIINKLEMIKVELQKT